MGRLSQVLSFLPKVLRWSVRKVSAGSGRSGAAGGRARVTDFFRPARKSPPTRPPAGARRWKFLVVEGGVFPRQKAMKGFLEVLENPSYFGEIFFNVPVGTPVTEHCMYPSRFVWMEDGVLYSQRAPSLEEHCTFTDGPVDRHESLEALLSKYANVVLRNPSSKVEFHSVPPSYEASQVQFGDDLPPLDILETLAAKKTIRYHKTVPEAGIYYTGTIWQEGDSFFGEIYRSYSAAGDGHLWARIIADTFEKLERGLPRQ